MEINEEGHICVMTVRLCMCELARCDYADLCAYALHYMVPCNI